MILFCQMCVFIVLFLALRVLCYCLQKDKWVWGEQCSFAFIYFSLTFFSIFFSLVLEHFMPVELTQNVYFYTCLVKMIYYQIKMLNSIRLFIALHCSVLLCTSNEIQSDIWAKNTVCFSLSFDHSIDTKSHCILLYYTKIIKWIENEGKPHGDENERYHHA